MKLACGEEEEEERMAGVKVDGGGRPTGWIEDGPGEEMVRNLSAWRMPTLTAA